MEDEVLAAAETWMAAYWSVVAFVLGAAIGSFLNVVIVRLPAGESVVRPRSKCPRCGDMIPGWLNIPILSWFVLRGRCRACRLPISVRYPVVELLTALLFLAAVSRFGPTLAAFTACVLASGLVVITFVDIDIWEIPDEISLPGIIAGAVLRPFAFGAPWWDGLAGAALGAFSLWALRALYELVRKQEGLGLGDLKLLAMIGAFLGPAGLLPTVLIASFSGAIVGIVLVLAGRRSAGEPEPAGPRPASDTPPAVPEASRQGPSEEEEDDWVPPKNALPFGPFLALGALAQLFFGPGLMRLFFGGALL